MVLLADGSGTPWRIERLATTLVEPPEAIDLAVRELAGDGLVTCTGTAAAATAAAMRFERVFHVSAERGGLVRRRRRRPDAGQSALADLAGLHPAEVEALERGVGDPRLSAVLDLAAALGVGPADLLEGVHSPRV
jgi:hypothetical protein